MHEYRFSENLSKAERYAELLPQARALIELEAELLPATLGNVCALLKEAFGWLWVGFYLIDKSGENLILAPFQGPPACTRIAKGRGVCGQAWVQERTLVVDNVHAHHDHIACSSRAQSEIVVPLRAADGRVVGVLDADADTPAAFDEEDARGLEAVCALLSACRFRQPEKPL